MVEAPSIAMGLDVSKEAGVNKRTDINDNFISEMCCMYSDHNTK